MSSMIQIRNVPSNIHRRVKARAALSGMSMSEYILRELERVLDRPTRQELMERISALPAVDASPPPASVIREDRERR